MKKPVRVLMHKDVEKQFCTTRAKLRRGATFYWEYDDYRCEERMPGTIARLHMNELANTFIHRFVSNFHLTQRYIDIAGFYDRDI